MWLTSPRFIAPCIVLSVGALTIASCAQQNSPTSPSALTPATSLQPGVTEYFVTLYDEAPAPEVGRLALGPPPPSGSAPVPWPPGPPPPSAPGVPVPTPPTTHFRVSMKIDPEPVRHSGVPVGISACRDLRYTWYYDQHLHAESGVSVTFTERENFFDGRFVSRNSTTIHLPGNDSAILRTRWCSGHPIPHYAQTRFKGKDESGDPVNISGPWVRLLTP